MMPPRQAVSQPWIALILDQIKLPALSLVKVE